MSFLPRQGGGAGRQRSLSFVPTLPGLIGRNTCTCAPFLARPPQDPVHYDGRRVGSGGGDAARQPGRRLCGFSVSRRVEPCGQRRPAFGMRGRQTGFGFSHFLKFSFCCILHRIFCRSRTAGVTPRTCHGQAFLRAPEVDVPAPSDPEPVSPPAPHSPAAPEAETGLEQALVPALTHRPPEPDRASPK